MNPSRFALHDAVPHAHGNVHSEERRLPAEAGAGRRASMRRPSALITPALAMDIAEREASREDELEVERVSNMQADHFVGAHKAMDKLDAGSKRSNSLKMAEKVRSTQTLPSPSHRNALAH